MKQFDVDEMREQIQELLQHGYDMGLCPLDVSVMLDEIIDAHNEKIIVVPGPNFPAKPS